MGSWLVVRLCPDCLRQLTLGAMWNVLVRIHYLIRRIIGAFRLNEVEKKTTEVASKA